MMLLTVDQELINQVDLIMRVIYIVFFLGYIAVCLIPMNIAGKKGYSKIGFFLFGLIAFVPALVVALLIEDKNKEKRNQQFDPAREIMKYKELLDAGAITEIEYENKKNELLNVGQIKEQ